MTISQRTRHCPTCRDWTSPEESTTCSECLTPTQHRLGAEPYPLWRPAREDAPSPTFDRLPAATQVALLRALVSRAAHRLRDEGIGDGSYAPVWRAAYEAYESDTGHRVLRSAGEVNRAESALDLIIRAGGLAALARVVTGLFGAEDQL